MVTKEQALKLRYGAEVHYTGRHDCTRVVGPRGGIRETITRCRVTGACKTWKREPARFRLPVKYGLREYAAIDSHSWSGDPRFWHVAADCPLNSEAQS